MAAWASGWGEGEASPAHIHTLVYASMIRLRALLVHLGRQPAGGGWPLAEVHSIPLVPLVYLWGRRVVLSPVRSLHAKQGFCRAASQYDTFIQGPGRHRGIKSVAERTGHVLEGGAPPAAPAKQSAQRPPAASRVFNSKYLWRKTKQFLNQMATTRITDNQGFKSRRQRGVLCFSPTQTIQNTGAGATQPTNQGQKDIPAWVIFSAGFFRFGCWRFCVRILITSSPSGS